jgi:hypothetical protein
MWQMPEQEFVPGGIDQDIEPRLEPARSFRDASELFLGRGGRRGSGLDLRGRGRQCRLFRRRLLFFLRDQLLHFLDLVVHDCPPKCVGSTESGTTP